MAETMFNEGLQVSKMRGDKIKKKRGMGKKKSKKTSSFPCMMVDNGK
tara:strand:+ start:7299 stop:7439 length:141 start_codon:yes stop_codon:yes gene_type:complete